MKETEFDVTMSRGALSLQQTQRNNIKKEIIQAIYEDMKELLEEEGYDVYITEYGPVIEVLNSKVEERVIRLDKVGICSGLISIQLDAVIKNLDTNPALDEEDYLHQLRQKELKKIEADKRKKEKTQRDAEVRAEKARRREETLARLERERD